MIQGGQERVGKQHDATVVPFEGRVKGRLSDSAAQPPIVQQQSHFFTRVRDQMAMASVAIGSLENRGTSLSGVSGEPAQLDLQLEILNKCSAITLLLQMFIDETRRVNAISEGASPGGRTPQDETASAFSVNTISLSSRERSILELIGHGYSNKESARQIGITAETVKSHVKRIFIKLKVDSRAQAVWRAQTLGLLGSS